MKGEPLPGEEKGWRGCYRHKNRVAIRDCACCGRPICKECESESGDNLLCLPCKQDLKTLEEEKNIEQHVELELRKGRERAKLDLGEVTVFEDGTVVNPEPEPPTEARLPAEEPEEEKCEAGPEYPPEEEYEEVEEKVRAAEVVFNSGVAGQEVRGEPKPRTGTKKPVPAAEATAIPRRTARRRLSRPGRIRKHGRREKEFKPGGRVKQLLYAMPFALITAGSLSGIWLLVAALSKNWNQASVFTIGIAVPWVFYKSTIIRKHLGERVWSEPPPAIMISGVSGAIVLACIPLVEYFAFRILGGGGTVLPWGDFVVRFFKPIDWVFIIGAVLLAFLIPFVSGMGGAVRKPELKEGSRRED